MCAHNERIYTFSRDNGRIVEPYLASLPSSYVNSGKQQIMDLLIYLKYYLAHEDYCDLITSISAMLVELKSKIALNAFDNVRGSMGIRDISHLQQLLVEVKNIEYNRF